MKAKLIKYPIMNADGVTIDEHGFVWEFEDGTTSDEFKTKEDAVAYIEPFLQA